MTVLDTIPNSVEMGAAEVLPLGINCAPLFTDLPSGQSPVSPVVTVVNRDTGLAVTLANSAAVNGQTVEQIVDGPTDLQGPGAFQFSMLVTASPSNAVFEARFLLIVIE